jgi:hypothetical protein
MSGMGYAVIFFVVLLGLAFISMVDDTPHKR